MRITKPTLRITLNLSTLLVLGCTSPIRTPTEIVDISSFSFPDFAWHIGKPTKDQYAPYFKVHLRNNSLSTFKMDGIIPSVEAPFCTNGSNDTALLKLPSFAFSSSVRPRDFTDDVYIWLQNRPIFKNNMTVSNESIMNGKRDICIIIYTADYYVHSYLVVRIPHRMFDKAVLSKQVDR